MSPQNVPPPSQRAVSSSQVLPPPQQAAVAPGLRQEISSIRKFGGGSIVITPATSQQPSPNPVEAEHHQGVRAPELPEAIRSGEAASPEAQQQQQQGQSEVEGGEERAAAAESSRVCSSEAIVNWGSEAVMAAAMAEGRACSQAEVEGGRGHEGNNQEAVEGGRGSGHSNQAAVEESRGGGRHSLRKSRRPSPLRALSPSPDLDDHEGLGALHHLSNAAEMAAAASPLVRIGLAGGRGGGKGGGGGRSTASGLPPRHSVGHKQAVCMKSPRRSTAGRSTAGEGQPRCDNRGQRPDLEAVVEQQATVMRGVLQVARQQQQDMER